MLIDLGDILSNKFLKMSSNLLHIGHYENNPTNFLLVKIKK